MLGSPDTDEVEVNGITLAKNSPLRELQAACKFFGVSQSGSKLTCFQGIMSHLKEELQKKNKRTTHSLIHLTLHIAPRCESCILHRARQDRHLRTGSARMSGIPVISLDLCFSKACIIDRRDPEEVELFSS